MKRISCRGFSLIELVIVIVLVSVSAVAILGRFSQASRALTTTEHVQTGTQLAQAQAEQVMATRRTQGYTDSSLDPGVTTEILTGNYAGYTRVTTITEPVSAGCPTSATCKGVSIAVLFGGTTVSQLNFVLVSY